MPEPNLLLLRFRARRLIGGIVLLVALAAVAAAWGMFDVSLPAGTKSGSVALPLWVLLPLPAGAALAAGLASDLADVEAVAARSSIPGDLLYLLLGVIIASCLMALGLAFGDASAAIPASLRNLAFWTGLALCSGRLFGRRLAWAIPLAAFFPIDWFGFNFTTGRPNAWAIPLQPWSISSLLVALAVLVAGTVVSLLSAWHVRILVPQRLRR